MLDDAVLTLVSTPENEMLAFGGGEALNSEAI